MTMGTVLKRVLITVVVLALIFFEMHVHDVIDRKIFKAFNLDISRLKKRGV